MNKNLSKPIANGATAEIYDWDDGKILKLFFDRFGRGNIEYEARMARAVHASGLPVPAAGEIVELNGRIGLIYERVAGMALSDLIPKKPWLLFKYSRRLAEMHVEMHTNPMALDIPSQRERLVNKIEQAKPLPDDLRARALTALAKMPDGSQICHGDFHPGNVMASPNGEVVIDWIDATRGNPLADVARSTIIALGAADSSQTGSVAEKWMVRLYHAIYLRRYFALRPEGREEYGRWLPIVAAARLSEHLPEVEQWLLAEAAKV